jgi:hypothetical protein
MGLGFLVLNVADRSLFVITLALITLLFTGHWFTGGRAMVKRELAGHENLQVRPRPGRRPPIAQRHQVADAEQRRQECTGD